VMYAPLLAARRIIVNSRFSLAVMAQTIPALSARADVILNAVPGPPTPLPPRATLDGAPRLAYVGRLSPRKGVDLIVDALRLLHDAGTPATLDLYGAVFPGYEWYEEELRSLIASGGLQESVTLHGFVDDVWPGLAGADILVVPSRLDEPFGNTAVEGVLASRPVVVSATSGLLEATEGYATARRVPADSARAIAEAVAEIVASWETVLPQLEPARSMAANRHDPGVYGDHVAAVVAASAAAPASAD
ncbi:MAG: glycosyltransferase family 4 protein, partial [Propioniciclava sp.]